MLTRAEKTAFTASTESVRRKMAFDLESITANVLSKGDNMNPVWAVMLSAFVSTFKKVLDIESPASYGVCVTFLLKLLQSMRKAKRMAFAKATRAEIQEEAKDVLQLAVEYERLSERPFEGNGKRPKGIPSDDNSLAFCEKSLRDALKLVEKVRESRDKRDAEALEAAAMDAFQQSMLTVDSLALSKAMNGIFNEM